MAIRLPFASLVLLALGSCAGTFNPTAGDDNNNLSPEACTESLACCPDGQLQCSGDVDDKIVCVCEDTGWKCVGTHCRAAAPTPGGAGSWSCGYDAEFGYSCTQPGSISDPAPGGGADWSCSFDGELQQWRCVRSFPPNPSNEADGSNRWSCRVENGTVVCDGVGGGGSSNSHNGLNNNNGGSEVVPMPCEPAKSTAFQFIDTLDGDPDDELAVLGNREPYVACGVVMVNTTGYYNIFDKYLAESCTSQLDETGYLTITNSCNPSGEPTTTNAPGAFVVVDNDNTKACKTDSDCGAGQSCSDWYGGKCCVPSKPVFMGRFLLVAGEANKICLRHWCPLWKEAKEAGNDIGFIHHGCEQTNSIHLSFDAETMLCWDDAAEPSCN